MNDAISQVLERIRELEEKLGDELHRQRDELRYSFQNGKITFEREFALKNRTLKKGLIQYIRGARWPVILTAPIIYSLIIPFVILDVFISIYQAICFPVYRIPKVKRSDYLIFDRVKLDYLNGIQKLNCVYCSYGNGIIGFAREVAARTEQFWCPIKHAQKVHDTHDRYPLFTDYGDGEQYYKKIDIIKRQFEDSDR